MVTTKLFTLYVFFRKTMSNKEMERGPNKIILNNTDLVFLATKTHTKSQKVSYFNDNIRTPKTTI